MIGWYITIESNDTHIASWTTNDLHGLRWIKCLVTSGTVSVSGNGYPLKYVGIMKDMREPIALAVIDANSKLLCDTSSIRDTGLVIVYAWDQS